jgi:uncharacterized membrane protein YGL010W
MLPRLSSAQHLGLYAAFHRSRSNRLLHAACLPFICWTGLVVLWWLPLPRLGSVSLVTAVPLVTVVALSLIDGRGACWLAAWLLPLVGGAAATAERLAVWPACPLVLALHVAAWALAVDFGHTKLEPALCIDGVAQDSNVYFRRRYFVARHVGCATNSTDAFIQFSVSLLGSTHDLLALLRRSNPLSGAVEHEAARIRERLARGLPPFSGR